MKKQLLALFTGAAIGVSGTAVTIQGEEVEAAQIVPSDLYHTISVDDLPDVKFAKTDEGVRARANLIINPNIEGFQRWAEKISVDAGEGRFEADFKGIEKDLKTILCKDNYCNGVSPEMVTVRASLTEDGYDVNGLFVDGKWKGRASTSKNKLIDDKVRRLASSVIDNWCEEGPSELCKK